MDFKIRTTKPENGNIFYNTSIKGGLSQCVIGMPTDNNCNVLSNCVGYACGRFNEIVGKMQYPKLYCNAENFIEQAKNVYGLEISDVPTLGGIMVWQKGNSLSGSDGAGHVAIVEKLVSEGVIYTSESAWRGSAFYNATRNNNNGKWGMSSAYIFRGCIVNPKIGKVIYVKPEPPKPVQKFSLGTKVVVNGDLYKNANAENPVGRITNKTTFISRYVEGTKHPYNTTGDLGWMNENDIKLYEGRITYTVQSGDTLGGIASKFNMNWKELYAKNKFVIGNNPNLIKPGQILTVKE